MAPASRSARGSCVTFSEAASGTSSYWTEYSGSYDARSQRSCTSPGRSRISDYSCGPSDLHLRRSKSAAPERRHGRGGEKSIAVFGHEPPKSTVSAFNGSEGTSESAAGCPTKKCYDAERWHTRYHADEKSASRRSRAKSVDLNYHARESLIYHREEPLPVQPTKNTPGHGPVGHTHQAKNRHKTGWIAGAEDMHPAAHKKPPPAECPIPSEEALTYTNPDTGSPSRKKTFKADLEPSDELKTFNMKKAHMVERQPRQYTSKAEFLPSDEVQRRNDRAMLQGPDRVRPPRVFHGGVRYESEGLRHCMQAANYPQLRSPSDYGGVSGAAVAESCRDGFVVSSLDTDCAMSAACSSSWSSQAGVSEVPSNYSGRSRSQKHRGSSSAAKHRGSSSAAAPESEAGSRSAASGSQISGGGSVSASRYSEMRSSRSHYSSTYSSRTGHGSDCGSSSYISRRSSEVSSEAREGASSRAKLTPAEIRKCQLGSDAGSGASDSRCSKSTKSGVSSSSKTSDVGSVCSQGSFSMGGYSYGQRGRV